MVKLKTTSSEMASRLLPRLGLLLSLLCSAPLGAIELYEPDQTSVDLSGDVKTFIVGIYPYEHIIMPEDPYGQGMLTLRLKLEATLTDWMRLSLHHSAGTTAGNAAATMGTGVGTGSEGGVPQLVDLDWDIEDGSGYTMKLRVDRAVLYFRLPSLDLPIGEDGLYVGFDLSVGRQPVNFGSTFFFSPMDLVAPFSPTVIDKEYKPGIDAVRFDGFVGTSGKLTLVAAYAGEHGLYCRSRDSELRCRKKSPKLDEAIFAGRGGMTLGAFDVGLFTGTVHGDTVLGMDAMMGIAGVAFRGEATLTFAEDEDPFVRASLGADKSFDGGLSLMAEIYMQTMGADRPEDYLEVAADERFSRGEIWAMGRYYGAVSASYELLPIINLGLFALANLEDQSALLGPSLTWSISDEADFTAGGYFGLGERPEEPEVPAFAGMDAADMGDMGDMQGASMPEPSASDFLIPQSEFGMTPAAVYVELRAYF